MKPQFPTVQEQINYWNKKEGEELERVSRIQEESLDKRDESRDATNETREAKCLHLSCPKCHGTGRIQHGHDKGQMCVHMVSCKCRRCSPGMLNAASNPQEQAATTAKTLTQEEELCEIYDERERNWSLREEGSNDGEGESYSARQL